jgi:hypothetical protein
MTWVRWFLLGLVAGLAGLGAWWRLDHASQGIAADFVQQFETATVRRPAPDVFTIQEVTIASVTRPAITVQQPSRIAWDVTIPSNAWVETELGLKEEAWAVPGDGVLFRVGISLDGRYDELAATVVNPYHVPDDRRWVPVSIDLSPYAGRAVSLVLNTASGLEGDNRAGDLAVWGAPRLVTR